MRSPPPRTGSKRMAVGDTFAFSLETKKSLGQHFLRDTGIIARIADEAQASLPVGAERNAVEIGPGSGALTKVLLEQGWSLVAIERDERAAAGLDEHLAPLHAGRLTVVNADILKWDPASLAPTALQTPVSKPLCAGNLPYYITSDILFWFLAHASHFSAALFMVQDEVADRLASRPGSKDYGRLTVRMQLSCDVEKVLFVPASAFAPPPKVNSAVVRLVPKPSPFIDANDEKRFGEFTATLFSARRKMLRRALASHLQLLESRGGSTAEFWQQAATVKVQEETRPDAIAPDAILFLYRFLHAAA